VWRSVRLQPIKKGRAFAKFGKAGAADLLSIMVVSNEATDQCERRETETSTLAVL